MECGRSSLTWNVPSAPSACSYRQQVGRVSRLVSQRDNKHLKCRSELEAYPECSVLPAASSSNSNKFWWDWWRKNKQTKKTSQGSKAAPSCIWLKESSKVTKDKVQPLRVTRWEKDRIHSNSNNLNPREGKDDAVQHFSTASDEVGGGCIGQCQRPNATPSIWTKSVHRGKVNK